MELDGGIPEADAGVFIFPALTQLRYFLIDQGLVTPLAAVLPGEYY